MIPRKLAVVMSIAVAACGGLFAQAPPAQTPPAQTPPGQMPPAQAPPAQTPPAQTPSGQTPPTQTPPAPTPPPQDAGGPPPEAPGGSGAAAATPRHSPEDAFHRAGAAYEAGRYAEAASIYQSLLEEGFDDPRLHYNLGNARFKEGRLGPAILEYERAIQRDPSDADTRENLTYAELLIPDKVGAIEEDFPTRLAASFQQAFGPDRALLTFAILCMIGGAAGVPLWFARRPAPRKVLSVGVGLLVCLALITGAIAAAEIYGPRGSAHAIVLGATVDGRSAPASDGTVLFTVHEGLKVEVRGERSGWMQVALPNELVGWIETSQAERI